MSNEPSFYTQYGKRAFDLLLTIPGFVLITPLLGLIALLVRAQLGRPVLFTQVRPGLHGRPFTIYKFRTMTNTSDGNGCLLPDAQRLTRLGRFLRASSLDELPELWNVVKGEMSIVGPRPLRMKYLPLYTRVQNRRHDVQPGMTGWAQINGRNSISWGDKFKMDVWYTENVSVWLDLRILSQTFVKVLKKEGINANQQLTMPPFRGSNNQL